MRRAEPRLLPMSLEVRKDPHHGGGGRTAGSERQRAAPPPPRAVGAGRPRRGSKFGFRFFVSFKGGLCPFITTSHTRDCHARPPASITACVSKLLDKVGQLAHVKISFEFSYLIEKGVGVSEAACGLRGQRRREGCGMLRDSDGPQGLRGHCLWVSQMPRYPVLLG